MNLSQHILPFAFPLKLLFLRLFFHVFLTPFLRGKKHPNILSRSDLTWLHVQYSCTFGIRIEKYQAALW